MFYLFSNNNDEICKIGKLSIKFHIFLFRVWKELKKYLFDILLMAFLLDIVSVIYVS